MSASTPLETTASVPFDGIGSFNPPPSSLQQIDGCSIQTISALATGPDTVGNTTTAAKQISITTTAQQWAESVGSSDYFDYYKFSLTTQENVSLRLSGLSQQLSLALYNSSNQLVVSDVSSGSSDKSINRELAIGTYYLRVGVTSTTQADSDYILSGWASGVGTWSSLSGYGLINAASAVAQATNSAPFAEVADLGGNQWFVDMVKAPEVWAKGYTGKGITVAVVDTGIDVNSTALAGNIWTNSREIAANGKDDDGNGYIDDTTGWDFVENDSIAQDANGHGTHVAGIIHQIAPDAKIMDVRVLDATGGGSYANIAKGIRYAADNGANVINLSLGGSADSTLQSAIAYAYGKGVEVCMAAGNSGGATPLYPAAYATQYGIAVGAVDSNRNLAGFSNRSGSTVMDFVDAPGVNIYSTLPGNTWGYKSGTSMATPIVAAAVALLRSANSSLTPVQIEALLTSTASQLGLTSTSTTTTSTATTTAKAADIALPGAPAAQPSPPVALLPNRELSQSDLAASYYQWQQSSQFLTSQFQLNQDQAERFNNLQDRQEPTDPLTNLRKERNLRRNRFA